MFVIVLVSLEIPLPNVTAPILELVVEYLRHYTKEPMHTIPQVSVLGSLFTIIFVANSVAEALR